MKNIYELLEFDKVLSDMAFFAMSESGKKCCLAAEMYNDIEKINYELTLTDYATQILQKIHDNSDFPLENFENIERIFSYAKTSSALSIDDIAAIVNILKISRHIFSFLERNADFYKELADLRKNLYVNKTFEDKIKTIFDESFEIKNSASPELKKLYQSKRDTEINIKNLVNKLLNTQSFTTHLQESFYTFRDERIVFAVRAEAKNKIKGIVHDISATGQTFFIEPQELVEINNKLREINVQILAEKERIIKTLCVEIFSFADLLLQAFHQLVNFDFVFARAKYALKTNSCRPSITNKKIIELKDMKNPVLMGVCENIVTNDFYIGTDYNTLIITGSNTGGKTVVLKTVGLFVLMSKAGFFIPAFSAKIYPFKKVFADIGDNQNIIQSLSTFSSHMKNLITMINNADEETLVLIDEITSGTDPKEGATLAQIILEYFTEKESRTIVTTHYGELKSLAYQKNGFKNASVEFDTKNLTPTFKLLIGIPGASHAIEIAKNLGLKKELIEKAKNTYYQEKDNTAKILTEMQKTQFELSQAAAETIKLKNEAQDLKQEYEKNLYELKKEKKRNIQIYKKKYENKIEYAKDEIKAIMKEVREEKSEKIARRAFEKLNNIGVQARKEFSSQEDEIDHKYKKVDWNKVKIGDKLLLKSVNQHVEIISLPDKNDNLQVLMGMIKSFVKKKDLAAYNAELVNTTAKLINKYQYKTSAFKIEKQELSHTIDLRGERADNAIEKIELYLDKANLANLTPVYIIHGHGSGVLKQIIREYLQTSPYVANFTPASNAEGGDGVTVVELK